MYEEDKDMSTGRYVAIYDEFWREKWWEILKFYKVITVPCLLYIQYMSCGPLAKEILDWLDEK